MTPASEAAMATIQTKFTELARLHDEYQSLLNMAVQHWGTETQVEMLKLLKPTLDQIAAALYDLTPPEKRRNS